MNGLPWHRFGYHTDQLGCVRSHAFCCFISLTFTRLFLSSVRLPTKSENRSSKFILWRCTQTSSSDTRNSSSMNLNLLESK